ncbi:MAG TPA: hypothetical protein DDW85_03490 [Porphyromonadaceae bacterium]|nr:hypothetical protein [Porphyromonadaceae bacterium]
MKKAYVVIGICLAALLAYFSSCDDNSQYSLGDFVVSIATVEPTGANGYHIVLDNGKRLLPVHSDIRYMPGSEQRVVVNYTILSDAKDGYDYYVKINDIWNILTKQVIELNEENADSIGNDPIQIHDIWVGGDYLNVDFFFNYGKGEKPHAVNMVKNTLSSEATLNGVDLEFRHNAYNSASSKLYRGFVSFNLKPLQRTDVDSVVISVKVKDWAEEKNYEVVYRYNQAALANMSDNASIPVITSDEYY